MKIIIHTLRFFVAFAGTHAFADCFPEPEIPLDVDAVALDSLASAQEQYRVRAFIIEYARCPEGAFCILPNGYVVAKSKESPYEPFRLLLEEAQRLQRGKLYDPWVSRGDGLITACTVPID